MDDLPARVLALIHRDALLPPGTSAAVACSGGADSTCLLHVLCELAAGGRIDARISVCHLDHGLRGEAAREDLEFVRTLAERLGLSFHGGAADVKALAAGEKLSIEEAARRARYTFYAEAAGALSVDRLAVAHTADDQAETVLFRIIRGTGLDGLGGMGSMRTLNGLVQLVRPLLTSSRSQVVRYLKAHDLGWRDDETNLDTAHSRNRIRLELIPRIEQDFNPKAREALVRMSEIARGAASLLEKLAEERFESCLLAEEDERIELKLPAVAKLDAALELLIFRHALKRLGVHERELGYLHMEQLRDLLSSGTGKWRPLPGGARASIVYDRLVLEHSPEALDAPPPFQVTMPLPGRIELPDGTRVSALKRPGGRNMLDVVRLLRGHEFPRRAFVEVVDADRLPNAEVITIRSRRAGDRFTPLGSGKSRRLKSFYVNQKIPREQREQSVLFESGDEIIWVAPHRIADTVKLTGETRNIVLFRYDLASDEQGS